jgi:glycogen debranching enzyme
LGSTVSRTLATNVDQVTVIEHAAFAVSDARGDMVAGSYHGLYVTDTRYLSRWVLRLGGRRLESLSAGVPDHRRATFYLTNAPIGALRANSIAVFRDRVIDGGIAEHIRLISYETTPQRLRLSFQLGADFVDIFEVLGRAPLVRTVSAALVDGGVGFAYERSGHHRSTHIAVDQPFRWERDRLSFDVQLGHGIPWDLNVRIEARERAAPRTSRMRATRRPRPIDPQRVEGWAARVPRLESDDQRLMAAWRGAVRDMRALLLAEPGGSFIPAAGVPWFMAVYGRDASITALQTMIAGSDIAYGTLRELAAFQGKTDDPFRDEERGKIPHEVRRGELAALDHVPHARYYGSVDATPLYVGLFAEACRWSGWLVTTSSPAGGPAGVTVNGDMPPVLRRLLPAAERALAWLDRRATGRDGLIWYQRLHRTGIRNQVWKDSWDSYRFADGRIARTPIAAVEVQGYAIAAWRAMADVLEGLGREAEAARRRNDADVMARRIEEAFWMDEAGTYAMGLDRYGHKIDAITSNPGHLLWSGAIGEARAAAVADRLMAPDMFTGWGIRTMSSEMAAYNPIGYHIGSVWPHDNSIIAAGLARYGQAAAAWRIADAMLDASSRDRAARLPELFAGFDRGATPDLVLYPRACAPQAWATGTIFHMVQVLLGLEPSGDALQLAPSPLGPRLNLTDLRIGNWRGDVDNRSRKTAPVR